MFDQIPFTALRGLLKLDNTAPRNFLIPSPKACIVEVERIVPKAVKKRTEDARKWIFNSIKDLSKAAPNVEDFVE